MKRLIFLSILLSVRAIARVSPADTLDPVTAQDVQTLKTEVYKLFDLYEQQYHECLTAKENIRLVSLANIETNLQEIDRLSQYISRSNAALSELKGDNATLQIQLFALKAALRKAKRRAWFERAGFTLAAAATIVIITTSHPP